MLTNPLISIITPAYNHERYIVQCIQSVLDQSYSNWEMLIINDGSTDKTSSIIHEFEAKDARIKVFDRHHVGIYKLAETYNFALSRAEGDFIAILEGDDFWISNKLELQIEAFNRNPESILCWGKASSVIDNNPEIYETHPKSEKKNGQYYFNEPVGSFFNIVFDDFPAPLTFLIRKEALIKAGSFIQILPFPAVDLPTILALSKTGRFHYIPSVLGSWRQHANQVTKNNSIDLIAGSSMIIIEHYQSLSVEMKQHLKFDMNYILKTLKVRKLISYARSGRFKLIRKQFTEARADYKKAIFTGSLFTAFSWKLRAFTGLIMSYFHMDVEGIAKLLGKKSYT